MTVGTRPFDEAEYLDTDEAVQAYIRAAFEDGDPAIIRYALNAAARARGMTALAREIGMTREGLYRALGDAGNPSFDAVARLVRAMGLQLQVAPRKPGGRKKGAARQRKAA